MRELKQYVTVIAKIIGKLAESFFNQECWACPAHIEMIALKVQLAC